MWRVRQLDGEPRFKTEKEAVAVAAKAARTSVRTLELPCAKRVRRDIVEDLQSRFKELMHVYSMGDPKRPCVPGDLTDLLSRPSPVDVAPGMLVPLLLAKYGPHRDALLKVMQTKPKGPGVADGLYFQLVATVKLLSGKRLDACWTQNVGRKNCHHSGLVMFLWKGLALLQPVGKNRCKDFVQLGLSQRKFIVRKLDPTMKSKLESLDRFGRDLQNSCTPRTTEDWSIEVSKLQAALKGPPAVPGFSTGVAGYRCLWIIRCCLIWKMRAAGISHLKMQRNFTVNRFAALFPDQRGWILRLARHRNRFMNVVDLFKSCGYRGPPELFSMYTCLFGDTDLTMFLQSRPKSWLRTNAAALGKCLEEYRSKHGIPPHPAALLSELARGTASDPT